MVASVTQLGETHLPLKMRTVGERMTHLAREVSILVQDWWCAAGTNAADALDHVLDSVDCDQLRLLLSASLINRLDHRIPLLDGHKLSLAPMLDCYLDFTASVAGSSSSSSSNNNNNISGQSLSSFISKPEAVRCCIRQAIASYMSVYCTAKTWYYIRDKRRYPARIRSLLPPPQSNCDPNDATTVRTLTSSSTSSTSDMFSTSFTFAQLMDDLRAAKMLLYCNRHSRSIYCQLSML